MSNTLQSEFDMLLAGSKNYPKTPIRNSNSSSEDLKKTSMVIHGKEHCFENWMVDLNIDLISNKGKDSDFKECKFEGPPPSTSKWFDASYTHELIVDKFRFQVKGILGKGAFGATFLALDTKFTPPKSVAVKIMMDHKQNFISRQEAHAISWLTRKTNGRKPPGALKIVNLFLTFYQQGRLCIVLELYENFPLSEYTFPRSFKQKGLEWKPVANCKDKVGRLKRLSKVTFQIMTSLLHLHNQGVIHSDIKPDNILRLINKQISLRFCDFGNAIILNQIKRYGNCYEIQTLPFRAPELLAEVGFDMAIDIWSVGIIICSALTGKQPFFMKSKTATLERIVKYLGPLPRHYYGSSKLLDSSLLESLPDAEVPNPKFTLAQRLKSLGGLLGLDSREPIISFLVGLLELDPKKRFTPLRALSHPFLSELVGIDLNNLVPQTKTSITPPPSYNNSNVDLSRARSDFIKSTPAPVQAPKRPLTATNPYKIATPLRTTSSKLQSKNIPSSFQNISIDSYNNISAMNDTTLNLNHSDKDLATTNISPILEDGLMEKSMYKDVTKINSKILLTLESDKKGSEFKKLENINAPHEDFSIFNNGNIEQDPKVISITRNNKSDEVSDFSKYGHTYLKKIDGSINKDSNKAVSIASKDILTSSNLIKVHNPDITNKHNIVPFKQNSSSLKEGYITIKDQEISNKVKQKLKQPHSPTPKANSKRLASLFVINANGKQHNQKNPAGRLPSIAASSIQKKNTIQKANLPGFGNPTKSKDKIAKPSKMKSLTELLREEGSLKKEGTKNTSTSKRSKPDVMFIDNKLPKVRRRMETELIKMHNEIGSKDLYMQFNGGTILGSNNQEEKTSVPRKHFDFENLSLPFPIESDEEMS